MLTKGFIFGEEITFEINVLANQASGVLVTNGGTSVLCTTVIGNFSNKNFVPLTIFYIEKFSAINAIPGGNKRRELAPTDSEILGSRIIDRALRNSISEEFRKEIQVFVQVLSYDGANLMQMAIAGASVSLNLAGVTNKLVSAGMIKEKSEILHVVKGENLQTVVFEFQGEKKTNIESSIENISSYYSRTLEIAKAFNALQKKILEVAKVKLLNPKIKNVNIFKRLGIMLAAKSFVRNLYSNFSNEEINRYISENHPGVQYYFNRCIKFYLIKSFLKNRIDNRKFDQSREVILHKNFLSNLHGSVLLSKGNTQSLISLTKSNFANAQSFSDLTGDLKRNFFVHYNFLPFCTNEVGNISVGRREIGHAELIRKAILPTLEHDGVIRIVADILQADGGTSMLSIFGTSIALNEAKLANDYVAGVSIGLVNELLVVDLTEVEDNYLSDADCKIAGTQNSITAIQLDVKAGGINLKQLQEMIKLANTAIKEQISKVQKALPKNRVREEKLSKEVKIEVSKIGIFIGKKGENIKKIESKYATNIKILENGMICVFGNSLPEIDLCIEHINEFLDKIDI